MDRHNRRSRSRSHSPQRGRVHRSRSKSKGKHSRSQRHSRSPEFQRGSKQMSHSSTNYKSSSLAAELLKYRRAREAKEAAMLVERGRAIHSKPDIDSFRDSPGLTIDDAIIIDNRRKNDTPSDLHKPSPTPPPPPTSHVKNSHQMEADRLHGIDNRNMSRNIKSEHDLVEERKFDRLHGSDIDRVRGMDRSREGSRDSDIPRDLSRESREPSFDRRSGSHGPHSNHSYDRGDREIKKEPDRLPSQPPVLKREISSTLPKLPLPQVSPLEDFDSDSPFRFVCLSLYVL